MRNKIEAAMDRKDIRDFFDMEFLLRQGVSFDDLPKEKLAKARGIINRFKIEDFKVTLGAVLDGQTRKYYVENGFGYLLGRMNTALNA